MVCRINDYIRAVNTKAGQKSLIRKPFQIIKMSFENLDLIEPILRALKTEGYEIPTPIQEQAIPIILQRKDLLGCAQTGTGKTAAFAIPIIQILHETHNPAKGRRKIKSLIVTPTRELAIQIGESFAAYGRHAGLKHTVIFGGVGERPQTDALRAGIDILIATPGRLLDLMNQGYIDLRSIELFVLDEADRMLDMGFIHDVKRIIAELPRERQSLFFSATMPKPIVALAKRYQEDALRISTVGEDRGHGDIAYQAMAVSPSDIEHAVINILRYHEAETAMLFCATRDNVRHLHASLVERGFAAVALSGEHSQNERNYALQALRDKRARVCVATDVAARGIDLPSLSLVVHVEIPRDAETLQHRTGSTGARRVRYRTWR